MQGNETHIDTKNYKNSSEYKVSIMQEELSSGGLMYSKVGSLEDTILKIL